MKTANLQPLKITAPDDTATGSIYVRCRGTAAVKTWNEAARDGWTADANGKAFRDYYSPEGARLLALGVLRPPFEQLATRSVLPQGHVPCPAVCTSCAAPESRRRKTDT